MVTLTYFKAVCLPGGENNNVPLKYRVVKNELTPPKTVSIEGYKQWTLIESEWVTA